MSILQENQVNTHFVMTSGVAELHLSECTVQSIITQALDWFDASDSLSFYPTTTGSSIAKPNGNVLHLTDIALPQPIWVIRDRYLNDYIAYLLVPQDVM